MGLFSGWRAMCTVPLAIRALPSVPHLFMPMSYDQASLHRPTTEPRLFPAVNVPAQSSRPRRQNVLFDASEVPRSTDCPGNLDSNPSSPPLPGQSGVRKSCSIRHCPSPGVKIRSDAGNRHTRYPHVLKASQDRFPPGMHCPGHWAPRCLPTNSFLHCKKCFLEGGPPNYCPLIMCCFLPASS